MTYFLSYPYLLPSSSYPLPHLRPASPIPNHQTKFQSLLGLSGDAQGRQLASLQFPYLAPVATYHRAANLLQPPAALLHSSEALPDLIQDDSGSPAYPRLPPLATRKFRTVTGCTSTSYVAYSQSFPLALDTSFYLPDPPSTTADDR